MEQLIYIDENDKSEAAKLTKGLINEETKTRVYVNALGTELAMKYLAQEDIDITNTHNLHNLHKLRAEFDIADILLPNIHIDVRVIYDENLIFIPKSHFDYNLTPDIYLIFKMSDEVTHVEFLGFCEPKLINKNNQNDEYYFIEKEKLSHPSSLKTYIKNFNGNTLENLTDAENELAHELAVSLVDENITDENKKNLISMLLRSVALREELEEFDNFEWISYHTVKTADFEKVEDFAVMPEETNPTTDEFEIFETADEFESFEDEIPETEEIVLDEIAELHEEIGETQSFEELTEVETLETEQEIEELPEEEILEIEDSIEENLPETTEDFPAVDLLELEPLEEIEQNDEIEPVEQVEEIENLVVEEVENIEPIEETDEVIEIATDDDVENFDENLIDNTLENNFETPELATLELADEDVQDEEPTPIPTMEDLLHDDSLEIEEEPEVMEEIDEEIPELEPIEFDSDEKEEIVKVEELEESYSDTETSKIIDALLSDNILDTLPDEDTDMDEDGTTLTSVNDLAQDNSNFVPYDEPIEIETTSFDSIEPMAETEISPVENSEPEEVTLNTFEEMPPDPMANEDEVNSEEDSEAVDINNFESSDEYIMGPPETEDLNNTVDINDLNTTSAEEETVEISTEATEYAETETPEEFLNSIAEEETVNENQPEVYENSTTITNENIVAGEVPIDINQPTVDEVSQEEIEKLELLYNNNLMENEEFEFVTSKPEKGKKAIVLAGVIVAMLAGLLLFGSMNKSDDKTAENGPNILENNLPESLDNIPQAPEQQIPDNIENVTPKDIDKSKLEDTIKQAKADAGKTKAPMIESPYIDVQKLTWSVPDYLSYNNQFKQYLQTAGKSLKLSLSSDLLLATEYAYSNLIQVDITLTKEGSLQDAKVVTSSGSTQIDNIVLRTVKETLNVLKAPAGVIIGANARIALKIYL